LAGALADQSQFVRQIQEQLLDAQDKVGELEEVNERQRDEIAALKARLAAASQDGHHGSDEAMEALRQRNAELEKVRLASV